MRRFKVGLILCISCIGLIFSSLSNAQFVFEELSTSRDRINFPELSEAEKLQIAEQAQVLLEGVYVHRFQKQDFYPGVTDPVPAIQGVIDNLENLSVAEMEEQIYDIFSSQRDLHLNYIFPQPYASASTFLPLTFTRTRGRFDFFQVRVDSVNADRFAEFAPDQRVPEVGDRVVSYNGLPVRTAVNNLLAVGQGANRFGGFNRAVARLTFAPQIVQLLPEEDEVTITLRSSTRGANGRFEHYSITVPWITRTPEPVVSQRSFSVDVQRTNVSSNTTTPRKISRDELQRQEDLYQKLYSEFRQDNGLMPLSTFPSNASNEPELTWGIIENRLGKFGYLRLDSFVPINGVDFTVQEIRRLIFEELSDTRGLIFDVRDNGGGFGRLADELPQLFTRGDAVSSPARLLNTEVNSEIFNNSLFGLVFPQFTNAINSVAGTDETHSPAVPFNTPESINAFGQSYYGPVAVLANANSYSASDFFACQMQDSRAAFLFGEEPRTGAGGADVIEQSTFAQFVPTAFQPLPATHRARVSFRQAIRAGTNEGEFIEDFGCRADLLVSPTKSDLLDGGDNQIKTITRALAYLSYFPRFRSSVRPPSNDLLNLRATDDLAYPLVVENTPKVRISINGEVVDEIYTYGYGSTTVPFAFPADLTVGTVNNVLIEGVNYFGRRLWNLKRQVVLLEPPVVIDDGGFEIDFAVADSPRPFSIINQNPAENGWNIVSPNLQIGFNPTYADNVASDAVLALDLSSRSSAELSFDMAYDTEIDFDFIEVLAVGSDGTVVALLQDSGTQPLQTYNFDISAFAGQSGVQIIFRFTSDAAVVAPGVQLQRVSVQ